MGFRELVIWKKTFPSPLKRFCTDYLKIRPFQAWIEKTRLENPGVEIVAYSGVRAAESDERARLAPTDIDANTGCRIVRPLLDWTIEEIWEAHKRYGIPINPLYFTGRTRVGCRICVMSRKKDVRTAVLKTPSVITDIGKWEDEVSAVRGDRASFFISKTIPERYRTATWKNEDGIEFKVCTLADVARWSMTAHGAKRDMTPEELKAEREEDEDFDGGLSCKSAMGHCE